MVVQHNMQAANANRMLNLTVNGQQKSTEKLSSGYRINRAADDAAGLAISEKMRSQIRGLDRASTNAQDGISVVQTAEGALNEVHSMLQRMNELATQAANDTNTTNDRKEIQLEVDQLTSEIDRVASTTQFNTMNLLDGSFTGKNLQVGSLSGQTIELSIGNMDAYSLGLAEKTRPATDADTKIAQHGFFNTVTGTKEGKKVSFGSTTADVQKTDITFTGTTTAAARTFEYDAKTNKWHDQSNPSEVIGSIALGSGFTATDKATITIGAKTTDATGATGITKNGGNLTAADFTGTLSDTVENDTYTYTNGKWVGENTKKSLDSFEGVTLNSGVTINEGAKITVTQQSDAVEKGDPVHVDGKKLSVSSHDDAEEAMTRVQTAIDQVSSQRATLGAVQNRLEHTIANLDTTSENTQAAESRIRDTDMAKEMVTWSKNNILAQAGQSMLAQANQSNQGVLSLLQ